MFAQGGKFICFDEWLSWAAGSSHVATVAGLYTDRLTHYRATLG